MEVTRCYDCASRLALDLFGRVQTELANGNMKKKKLVWLEADGCSGNIISFLNAEYPDFQFFVTEMVDLVYENSLIAKEGERAMEQLFSVLGTDFILVVEGAVSIKDNGMYNIIGRYRGQWITGYDAVRILGERASYVIAMGTCASDGGISAASPNPGECVSVQGVLQRKVINVPGCPCNPGWLLATLAHILLFGPPELDSFNRPLMIYGTTIHDRCQRRSYFDNGIFAAKLGEPACMLLIGCRGPVTFTDCPIRKWNQRINWPVQDDTPCIGCAQFGFPDLMEPFITYETTQGEQNL